MPVATDRIDFVPPPPRGNMRALLLALGAHGLLLLALTWGVNWKRQDQSVTTEAELWSALPQTAAPKLEAPPPPPPPAATQQVAPPPEASAAQRDADIAVERERQQKAKDRALALRQQALEKAAQRKEADEREKARRDAAKQASDQKADQKAADKQAAASAQKKLETGQLEEEKKQVEARRQDNIRRAQGLAGATGDAPSTGKAQTSSGPSPGYAGRISAIIKRNIVFTDDIAGNTQAEVTVRVAPDGTIVGKRLSKSSGNKAWDEAVLKAIDKTEVLPRDTDGRVVPEFPVGFRPRD